MAEKRLCSIDDCGKRQKASGFCCKHYERLRMHGDPLGGRQTFNGEPQEHYRSVVLPYDGDDCLIWPYSRNTNGYGQMNVYGKLTVVSRLVCTEVNGPPPTPEHESAHSCGRGHLGCVTKRHLSWKTRKENQADRLAHGTHSRGERHNKVKLTEADVLEIRAIKGAETQRSTAERYGVSQAAISRIHSRGDWSWLD